MRKFKHILIGSLLVAGTSVLPSCSDSFLEEDMVTSLSTQHFTTAEGLDELSTGMYQHLRFQFNYEWAYSMTQYGTDEFSTGGDRTWARWNTYQADLNSETWHVGDWWNNIYGNINSANIMIANVPRYYGDLPARDTRLGEAHFMRAYNYFRLVRQFGGVPLKLNPSNSVELEFRRNSEEEVFEQVIADFNKAWELLPAAPEQTGRITKWAAAHFLAKAYLTRANELYEGWNGATKQADLENAVLFADRVINESPHTLAEDFRDLWHYTKPNDVNETNPEIILAAQFSDNTATQGRFGNQIHLYYPSVYQNLPGMQRDIPGGREFQRLRSTNYAMDVYDWVNDSRFWKSFKTVYSSNRPGTAPVWEEGYAPSPELVGEPRFAGGEVAIKYIVNNAGDNRYTQDNIKFEAPHMFVRYFDGEAESFTSITGNYEASRWVALSKFMDGSRNSVASPFGRRDGVLARLAETYLIAAEAHGRLGDFSAALPYINEVRARAAYKEGEDRSYYSDGGLAYINNEAVNQDVFNSYSDKNTYYESNNIATELTDASSSALVFGSVAEIFASDAEFYDYVGANSDEEKFIHFILNERSRELMGEMLRWEDLARTKTLVVRATRFNDEAQPDPNKHYYRPLPQSYLDGIRWDGQNLTPEQKQQEQNPGY